MIITKDAYIGLRFTERSSYLCEIDLIKQQIP
jgi:hypothetical protein